MNTATIILALIGYVVLVCILVGGTLMLVSARRLIIEEIRAWKLRGYRPASIKGKTRINKIG